MVTADTARTPHLGLSLLLAVCWVFLVVWLSFQIAHDALSHVHHWIYFGLAIPFLLAPWLLRRLEGTPSRANKR